MSNRSFGVAAVLACVLLAAGSARANCVRFEESQSGSAYLINDCTIDMNASYGVSTDGDWTLGNSPLTQVQVPADSRTALWTRDNRPFEGKYKIKVFSCVAPTSLVYPTGGRPSCQINSADAG
jgi:hypothetical protein